jgi:hypothetical protein
MLVQIGASPVVVGALATNKCANIEKEKSREYEPAMAEIWSEDLVGLRRL